KILIQFMFIDNLIRSETEWKWFDGVCPPWMNGVAQLRLSECQSGRWRFDRGDRNDLGTRL
ncbi:MAG: hypothetical protein PVJ84_07295, partial [Desulfobacteraceae bacterium]